MTARWVRRDATPYVNIRAWPTPPGGIAYGPDVGNLFPGCPVDLRETRGDWGRVFVRATEKHEFGRVELNAWVLVRYLTETPGGWPSRRGYLAHLLRNAIRRIRSTVLPPRVQ